MQTIVVTGSTRSIGRGLAREFLTRGHNVVISGRSQASVDGALAELKAFGKVLGQPCDVRNLAQVQQLRDGAAARFGRVDIWINNAALAPNHKLLAEQALANERHGARIEWLTRSTAIRRFLSPSYRKRSIVDDYENSLPAEPGPGR